MSVALVDPIIWRETQLTIDVSMCLTCGNRKRWLGACCVERVRPLRCQRDLGSVALMWKTSFGLAQISNTVLSEKIRNESRTGYHNEMGTKFDIQEVGGVCVMPGKNSNLLSVTSCVVFLGVVEAERMTNHYIVTDNHWERMVEKTRGF